MGVGIDVGCGAFAVGVGIMWMGGICCGGGHSCVVNGGICCGGGH